MTDCTVVRRRTLCAEQLREGMLLDFEDGEPGIVSKLKHTANKVLFTARQCDYSLDRDEILQAVIIMRVVG